MDRTKWPAITGLVVGTFFITRDVQTSFAADKPSLSCILILACAAFAIIGVSRFLPKDDERVGKGQQYQALPLDEVGQPHSSRQPSPSPGDVRYPSSLRKLRIQFLVLVGAICLRVEILHQMLRNVQCTVLTWEPLVPFVFACWDYWRVQRQRRWASYDDPNSNVYDALEQHLIRKPYKYLIAVGLVSFGSILAIATTRSPASTYICAATLHYHWILPFMQRIGTISDIVIAYSIAELLHQPEGRGGRSLSLRFISVGWAFLFSAAFLLFCGTVNYVVFSTPSDRKRMLEISNLYMYSLVRLVFWGCLTGICALLAILNVGLMTVSLISTFVAICTLTTSNAWNTTLAFPPVQSGLGFIAICLVILGFATYFQIETTEARTHSSGTALFKRVPSWFYICLLMVFFIRTGLWTWSSSYVNYHPIDLLIYDAQKAHEAYVNQSSTSRTLDEAVKQYYTRYGNHPPPGFQHWYKYATERDSAIIDDFDGIYHDLLPFFALTPYEIRERTWHMISNPWHDASALLIRNGKAEIGSHVQDTHRWMLEGIQHMINPFAKWLPDMDLAFNVNDECRIAVPWEDIEPMRKVGREQNLRSTDELENAFSENRAEQWLPVPDPPADPKKEGRMTEMSWQRTFYPFGSVGCPPGSPARNARDWDWGRLCLSCVEQQSIGPFLANWTTAADICHQPDLANLHGFYLSPAAFKSVHELYPIFSQSKVHGFNDILYPSAWNYMDKAQYAPSDEHPDPPFIDKKNSLFWRGATSEGVSSGKNQWKGMTRQRFHHLANHINGTNPSQSILLPQTNTNTSTTLTTHHHEKFTYETLPIASLTHQIATDVHFVSEIVRCGSGDCPQQDAELSPLVPNVDFQSHWQHKYLLDLDGAGFSGRFLPFLHSHSLPFKAALFREWWDGRVTAWQHFVPLDLRGHGFWATLAYFAGLTEQKQGALDGDDVMQLEAHGVQGERIAESGRSWAGRVLRKEDMEIYMFRLLLEWGRLTDERRDSIGFHLDGLEVSGMG